MKTTFALLFALLLACAPVLAQRETFGYTTYTPPQGWTKTPQSGWVGYHREDKVKKAFCQMRIYEGFAHTGEPKANFDHFWQQIVAQPYKLAAPAQTDTKTEDGWTVVAGGGQVTDQGYPYACLLMVATGYGVTVPYFFLYDNEMFVADIERFADGLDIKKLHTGGPAVPGNQPNPPVANQNNQPRPNNPTGGTTGASSNNPTAASGKSNRIAQPFLTFNDGWASTAYDDYVGIVKNDTEVRLIFLDPAIDNGRPQNTSIFEPHYWDNIVKKYYRIAGQVLVKEKPQYSFGEKDIWMAPATDIATGRQGHVAMMLSAQNGNTSVITVFAPNAAYFNTNFTTSADFNRMWGYNKYYATVADIIGEWKNSGGNGMEYYNIYTGNSVGMATAHVSDKFIFSNNGTYQSEHTGTSTFQGSVSHGKSNYSGNYTLSDVTLTATGRGANDPGEFTCYFEAVKYGFTLRLINKKYTSNDMMLYRVK